jgi:GTPase SAR1 family protein
LTYESLPNWHKYLYDRLVDTSLFIVGNKMDLETVVSDDEARAYAESVQAEYFSTSALTGAGVTELFTEVASVIAKVDIPPEEPTPVPSTDTGTGYFSCCS